jgi:hypothetical protein
MKETDIRLIEQEQLKTLDDLYNTISYPINFVRTKTDYLKLYNIPAEFYYTVDRVSTIKIREYFGDYATTVDINSETIDWLNSKESQAMAIRQMVLDAFNQRFELGFVKRPNLVKAYDVVYPEAVNGTTPVQTAAFKRIAESPELSEKFNTFLIHYSDEQKYRQNYLPAVTSINQYLQAQGQLPRLIFDIGCYNGQTTEILQSAGMNTVIGIDTRIQPGFDKHAIYHEGNYSEVLSQWQEMADAIVCVNLIPALHRGAALSLLSQSLNTLKEGGYLFVGPVIRPVDDTLEAVLHQKQKKSKQKKQNIPLNQSREKNYGIVVLQKKRNTFHIVDCLQSD